MQYWYLQGSLEHRMPEEGRGWTGSCAKSETRAILRVFDNYLVSQGNTSYNTRFFIRTEEGNVRRHFRLTLKNRKVLLERADSRHLIHLPDAQLSEQLTALLAHRRELAAGGWEYLGDGVSVCSIPRIGW